MSASGNGTLTSTPSPTATWTCALQRTRFGWCWITNAVDGIILDAVHDEGIVDHLDTPVVADVAS